MIQPHHYKDGLSGALIQLKIAKNEHVAKKVLVAFSLCCLALTSVIYTTSKKKESLLAIHYSLPKDIVEVLPLEVQTVIATQAHE